MRALPALATLAVVLAAMPPAPAGADDAVPYALQPYSVAVDGQLARGWLAYPTTATPTTLLVYAHGCCGHAGNTLPHAWAGAYGAVVVGMDYRGNGHWNVWTGHRDSIAATEDLLARFPTIERTIIWGVSMGGEVSGMAVAARPDLYDDWVSTFGVVDLFQEFGALGLFPGIAANPGDPANPTGSWILEETGGVPGVAPVQEWTKRSPVHRALEMNGITRAYLVTGSGDLIVYPTETDAMFAGLLAASVPATMCIAGTGQGNLQGPFVPGVGVIALPTGFGPAAHDGRGAACSYFYLDQLLRGLEPDAGAPGAVTVFDSYTGIAQTVRVPPLPP